MKDKLHWFKLLPFGYAFRLVSLSLVRKLFKIPVTFSFSQGAEDILTGYLPLPKKGIYVDVGCNEPVRFNNTFNLYLQGWHGINVDANSDLIAECQRIRKQDISIRAAVSDTEKEVIFHKSKESAVSTIDEERLQQWKQLWTFSEDDAEKTMTRTLTSILDSHLPVGSQVDLLTIDVEGHDFQVLKGLDLAKYRPKVIIIEMHSIEKIKESNIYQYLTEKGYVYKYFAVLNAYFVDGNLE